jgi:hypothetical protein
MTRTMRTWFLGLLLLAAPLLHAQTIPFDAEIGYRWFDVSGNEGMYRTQINERSGFLIRRFTLATGDFEGHSTLVDRFRLDVSELGTGPAGSLRLEADRAGAYRLRVAYRGTEAFSELPAFANPLLAQGVVPGQHTYDRTRRMFDVDLDILPDAAFSPFIGYTFNDSDSDGTTTYNLGQDEFLLGQDLAEQDRELRLGASFRFASVYGRVTQGWRTFEGTETLALGSGAGAGNNPGSIRGQPVTAGTIVRTSDLDGSTPFTNLFVTGRFANRIQATATFVRFAAESDASEDENATGNFASFALGRFYRGLESSIASSAQNDTWRGGARVEATIVPNVDVAAGYEREHSDISGSALINTLFLQSITFGGADPRDLTEVIDANSGVEREEDVFHLTAAARAVGPFSFRAEFRNTSQDVTIAPDIVEIVVPGAQGGTFERQIRTFDGGANFSRSRLNVGLAWRRDTADDPIFRTDFLDRDRIRLRASWSTPNDMFRAGLTAEDLDQSNDSPDVGYDAETRQYSADLEFAPIAMLRLRGAFSEFETESHILIRRPENFTIEESVHLENGQSIEAGIFFQRATLSIDAGMTRFENEGTLPFDLDRLRLRVAYDFKTRYGVAFEWDRDEYSEASALGDYKAARYGLYLRLRP